LSGATSVVTSRFLSTFIAAISLFQGERKMEKYEVIVCGRGLSGVCAAIAAGRYGLKTAIVQDRPVFGGNASSEIRVNIGGAASNNCWARETGIINELFLEERRINYEYHRSSYTNSKREKEFVIYGDFFIDATEDGVVAFSSGAEYKIGSEGKD